MAMKLGDAAGSFTDINMTPLIDVMLSCSSSSSSLFHP
jgi:biopolymer transport protein ExbD